MPSQDPTSQLPPERLAQLLALGAEDAPADPAAMVQPGAVYGPGDMLDEFRIEAEVGRGGMGIVYKAEETALRRFVALKTLGPHIAGDPSAAKRFRREALLAARLSHPHIVRILHLDEQDPPRYFTMEFVAGTSLADKIKQAGFLSAEQAVQIAIQAGDALEYAHSRKVLHRDIKPSNILLENHVERVRITDFGIARDLAGTSPENTMTEGPSLGTPPFMSPEQNRGEELDVRTDVFSLGVTLYYMLTGRVPYRAQNRVELAEAFLKCKPLPPSHFNPQGVGEELDRVVFKMIAVDPAKRYRSCAEALHDLRLLDQADLWPSRWARLSRTTFRSIKNVTLLAGLLLIVFFLGWGLIHLLNDLRHPSSVGGVNPRVPITAAPYSAVVNTPLVSVFDQTGNNIWSKQIMGRVVKAEVVRLRPGQPNFLVVAVGGDPSTYGDDTGKILVYDAQGDPAWSKQTTEPYPYPGVGIGRMSIVDLVVADLWLDGHLQILAVSVDKEWSPSKISIYDHQGSLKRVYWHPGHLSHVKVFRPSTGERLRILAWGKNNGLQRARTGTVGFPYWESVVCLDPETMRGEAPPRWGQIGEGVEAWYGLLMPPGLVLERVLECASPVTRPEGSLGPTLELRVSGERFLYIDETGRIIHRRGGDSATDIEVPQLELLDESATQPDTQPAT